MNGAVTRVQPSRQADKGEYTQIEIKIWVYPSDLIHSLEEEIKIRLGDSTDREMATKVCACNIFLASSTTKGAAKTR